MKYSIPLALEASRFDRHINMFLGKFFGSSGSSEAMDSSLFFNFSVMKFFTSLPCSAACCPNLMGLSFNCGLEGNQPIRSDFTLQSITDILPHFSLSANGEINSDNPTFS